MIIFTERLNIHPSWERFISQSNIISELEKIQKLIGDNYTPEPNRALKFLESDLYSVKIIILGQDPYPQQGVAVGRAFEVSGLTSWSNKFKQSSLRNILRAIYLAYNNKPAGLNDIRREIENGGFKILAPDKLFDSWENQGVLLLNTTFTCEINNAGSHVKLWEVFTNCLLEYISYENPGISWFLWGNYAKAYEKYATGKKYICNHPMLAGSSNENDFLKCNCFSDTLNIVNWKGM